MKTLIILITCSILVGCDRQSVKHSKYDYLNDEMNSEVSLPRYKIAALEYQNSIHARKVAFKRVGHILIVADKAEIMFNNDHVHLSLILEVSNQATAFEWSDSKTIEERREVGDEICVAHIRRLASDLKCDVSSIRASWVCIDGNVDGKVLGSSITK